MDLNLVDILYDAEIEANPERERKPHHYPSSTCAYDKNDKFCGTCRRSMWYSMAGKPKSDEISAPAFFKMNVGDIIHEHLSDLLIPKLELLGYNKETSEENPVYGKEVAFTWQSPDLQMEFSGRMDGRYNVDGIDFAVEWKSTYGRGATMVQKEGIKEDALLQCAIYLEQDKIPVERIAVLYVCRDSGYFIGFWVYKDKSDGYLVYETMGTKIITKTDISFAGIVKALKEFENDYLNGMTPIADYKDTTDKKNKWRCEYCSYAQLCQSGATV